MMLPNIEVLLTKCCFKVEKVLPKKQSVKLNNVAVGKNRCYNKVYCNIPFLCCYRPESVGIDD